MEVELEAALSKSCDNLIHALVEYILPFIQLVAIIISCFNAFSFIQWKNRLYRYLCANATVDTIWLVLYFGLSQTIYIKDQKIILSLSFQYFQLLIPYLIRVVGMVSALIKIQIAFDRYFILTKGYIKGKIRIRLLVFFLISITFFVTNFLILKVYKIENCSNCTLFNDLDKQNSSLYFAYFNEFVQIHVEIKFIYALVQHLAILIYLIIIIVLNVLFYKKFKKSKLITNYKLKISYLNYDDKSDENNMELVDLNSVSLAKSIYGHSRITLMVFWISSLFIVDQLIATVIPTVAVLLFEVKPRLLKSLVIILRSIFSILNTVFYYRYYNQYRKILKSNLTIIFIPCMYILVTSSNG